MYAAIEARPLKQRLRESGIAYGDIFSLTYKSNGTRVGFYDRNIQRMNRECQDNYYSFLPGDKIWIIKKDENGFIMVDTKEEQYIKAMDPHFLQRVITLIMTNQAKATIEYRTPKRGKIFKMIESLFGSKQHLGEKI
jgi:hypothetical protein